MNDSVPRPTVHAAEAPRRGIESPGEECIHGMDDPSWCSYCLGHRPPAARAIVGPFPARYDSECDCGQPIAAGDQIVRWSDGLYRHEGCEA